jgi:hypothetical protein
MTAMAKIRGAMVPPAQQSGVEMLEETLKIVQGDRLESYGDPLTNHENIAGFWNWFLSKKLKADITPREVALMMVLVKVAREKHTSKHDNPVDIAGYAYVIQQMEYLKYLREEPNGKESGGEEGQATNPPHPEGRVPYDIN